LPRDAVMCDAGISGACCVNDSLFLFHHLIKYQGFCWGSLP